MEAYPIKKKFDCHLGLDKFIKEYVSPDKMTSEGAQEQIGRKTEFQRVMINYEIKGHFTETKQLNQNEVKGFRQELCRRWYRNMFSMYLNRALWSYGIPYVANIKKTTASFAEYLLGRTPLEALTGEIPEISQYLDFGFYDRVWFKEDVGIR